MLFNKNFTLEKDRFDELVLESSDEENELDFVLKKYEKEIYYEQKNFFQELNPLSVEASIEHQFINSISQEKWKLFLVWFVPFCGVLYCIIQMFDIKNVYSTSLMIFRSVLSLNKESIYSIICLNSITHSQIMSNMSFNSTLIDDFIQGCPNLIKDANINVNKVP